MRMRTTMRMKKKILFASIMVLGILVLITTTFRSRAENGRKLQQEYYDIQESTYIEQIRMILEEEGYPNAGINLTRVSQGNGDRTYQLLIHHKRIDNLNDSERNQLSEQLSKIGIGDTNSKILQKFFAEDC